ncbi:hypothetical protein GP486_003042 [Trichoglossum hirsutum]|uniref:O-methyltransferase C-terminal domain-containing protein n=1 Tax=Trichoglossum hirsutum TaxID=265104 RepID=A0A9P8LDU2_9PEZI|nr:hypothetical protein GP486_003042 [Trichoglossum hirsutum]
MALSTVTSSDVQDLLNEVNAAGSELTNGHADAGPLPESGRLLAAAQKLTARLQNPVERVLEIVGQSHQNAVIRACSELGIFELVPQSGTVSLQELVDKTGADRQLLCEFRDGPSFPLSLPLRKLLTLRLIPLGEPLFPTKDRLMRTLTATGTFTEVEAETWCDLYQSSLKLPQYLQRTAYGTKPDPDGFRTPFQYGENTKLNIFEWLKTRPEQLKTFNLAMEAVSFRTLQSIEVYPFGTELGLNPSSSEDEVLLVDVGGGHGHKVAAMRAKFPDLKGRMIVQDLKETIDEIQDPKGFEPMVHDFFAPQPVKGARAYFFGRILHDWSDEDCHRILSNTISAMRPGHSRILLSETVLPDTGVPPLATLLDIHMMLIGGMERSRKQWDGLLAPMGLEIVKIWGEDVNIIEARLKE